MSATPHGLHKALLSLLVPMMVVSGTGNLTTLAQASDRPANVVRVTHQQPEDQYSSVLSEPNFQHRDRHHRHDIPVQFLGINDLHGGLDTSGKAYIGGKIYENTGNVSRLAAYLDQAQRQFRHVHLSRNTFRVQAGDMVGASPANSTLLAHEPTMHALRAMKFQIGTLGNHEFDQGLPEFNRILTGGRPGKDADKLIQRYPHLASKMQEVVANVVRKDNGKQPYGYRPYTIRTVRAHGRSAKVGFIGIETTELPTLTYERNYKDYKVLDEAKTIAKYDRILNAKGVKAVVVLAHRGVQNNKTSAWGNGVDILQRVNKLDPHNNVGLFVGAHTHMYGNALVGKTHVVQALSSARAFDDTQGYINPKTGKFSALETHVYPVLSAKADPKTKSNRRVARIIKDANRRVAGKINAVIGKAASAEAIKQASTANGESPVGELVVDGQLFEAQKNGLKADFAMTNSGGVRSSLNVDANQAITWGAAQAVQPFGNVLQVVEMTGAQVIKALNNQYSGGFKELQVAGLRYTFAAQGKTKQVVQVTKADGQPLDPQATYRVVINDFLHGNKSFTFQGTKIVGSLASDTEVFVQYVKDMQAAGKPIVAPQANRKVFVKADAAVLGTTLPNAQPAA